MKKYEIIKLNKSFKNLNINAGTHGIILDINNDNVHAFLFNDKIEGDYAFLSVKDCDFEIEKEKLPDNLLSELIEKAKSIKNKKTCFKNSVFNDYDLVEIIKNRDNYFKLGLTKGDRGVIVDSKVVNGKVLVDFSDLSLESLDDCVLINVDDIIKLN